MEGIVSGILWKSKVDQQSDSVGKSACHRTPHTQHMENWENKCKIKTHKTLKLLVVGAYNFSTWKAEAGGLRVQCHLLHNKLGQLELHEIIKKKSYKKAMWWKDK